MPTPKDRLREARTNVPKWVFPPKFNALKKIRVNDFRRLCNIYH
jgi:hypothetical protein